MHGEAQKKIAVVLLNLGGPDSLDAVKPFLRNLFSDRDLIRLPAGWLWQWAFARLVATRRAPVVREYYTLIGGRSPIRELTEAQAKGLEVALGGEAAGVRVFVAMRAWNPRAVEAARAVAAYAPDRIVVLPLFPQFSFATTHSCLKDLRIALKAARVAAPVTEIDRWSDDAAYLHLLAARIRDGLARFPEPDRANVAIVLSAHGLPQKYVDDGDPYYNEIVATADAVRARVDGQNKVHLSFQSRLRGEWLRPYTDDLLLELAQAGVQNVLVVPLSFVCDHVETLYEIDILLKNVATQAGIARLERTQSFNGDAAFIAVLAGLVRRAIEPA